MPVDRVSVVIPALNEEETVAHVVDKMRGQDHVDEVIVVDNRSTDDTAAAARAAGARVISEERPGMGRALKTGFDAATHDWIVKIDADLATFNPALVALLAGACDSPDVGLVKGVWQDPDDDMPMTRLLIKPAIRLIVPGLAHLAAPNSGIYLFDRRAVDLGQIDDGIAADIDVMLRVHGAGRMVSEVEIGEIRNDPRTRRHYNAMAEQILNFFLETHANRRG